MRICRLCGRSELEARFYEGYRVCAECDCVRKRKRHYSQGRKCALCGTARILNTNRSGLCAACNRTPAGYAYRKEHMPKPEKPPRPPRRAIDLSYLRKRPPDVNPADLLLTTFRERRTQAKGAMRSALNHAIGALSCGNLGRACWLIRQMWQGERTESGGMTDRGLALGAVLYEMEQALKPPRPTATRKHGARDGVAP